MEMVCKNFLRQVLITLLTILMNGCQKEDDGVIAFVGDSITERWDLRTYFPNCLTLNYGLNGAGIRYVQSLAGSMQGKKVVVLIGTNDNHNWNEEYIDTYAASVRKLDAKEVIIVSILPRKAKGDRPFINADIEAVNEELKAMSAECGWKFVDVFHLFQEDDIINWNCYTDGLHLSDYGYEILGHEIIKVL